ncbi:Fibrinogen C domain-containing protein 1,Angiopoietin-related protein 7,Fibrinogen C domain-containing protein 1-B,Ficolin-1 [Mytilus edulis]|uniref:Fibrinogen C domain-containing protein 1,Angiopoietin-related protein 7,Fibrinogen C domain-containing protein 1-B,Ficolin-1 n=1 Tax=Mytilus edulis TaxID=6550 RepID=A0A8S3QZM7_MYTED|nr:Fibrinogen C domain-containing protein 1,Angiopoietin-related protein 7,Fibrinogen C domain-containing protein 1-B,Ficolin-1 [Mytilus edulis]
MHRKLLLTAFLLIFEQSDGHEISKDERVAEVSDKVAKRITKRTSPCEDLGFRPSDCGDLKKSKYKSGIYKIYPDRSTGFYVYCDMRNYGGGWTVFQRRTNGYVGFYRDWRAYNEGFGNLKADFWLGNEYLSKLTQQGYYILRIDMWDFHYNHRYAIYNTFVVKNEMSGYKLEVAKYTGNAEPTVLRGIKEDGGITNVIAPILTGSISMDTIVATLMVLIGIGDHERPSDCGDLKKSEYKSGVYKIYPDGTWFSRLCDMETDERWLDGSYFNEEQTIMSAFIENGNLIRMALEI